MPIKSRENLMGARAYLLGIILSVLVGIFVHNQRSPIITGILAGLGIVVGYFVSQRDSQTFLLASVTLVLVSYAGIQGLVLDAEIRNIPIGGVVSATLGNLLVLFVPATIIAALKTVFSIAKS